MVKFIHTADWHLGMQAHFLPDEARARFAQDRFDAVGRIAELALEEECSFVVVAGDVFDSNHVDRQVVAKAVEALAAFAVPVFLLPGNHDPLDPTSVYRTATWIERKPVNVILLEDTSAVRVPGVEGVEVVGVPWHAKHQLGDPVAAGYAIAAQVSGLGVVIGHGIVDELSPDGSDPSLIVAGALREALDSNEVHYVALGDRHSVTEIEDAGGRAWYSGTPVSSDYGELDPNEVLLVQLDEGTCAVERHKVGAWTFLRQAFDVNGDEDIESLERWLDEQSSKHTTVVKLVLRGTLGLVDHARLADVLDHHGLTFASLNTWERHSDLVVAPDAADLESLDVSGYVRDVLDDLAVRATDTGEQALVAQDALNLLYRLGR